MKVDPAISERINPRQNSRSHAGQQNAIAKKKERKRQKPPFNREEYLAKCAEKI